VSQVAERWIGLDVGGTKILAVTVDPQLGVLDSRRIATHAHEGPEAVIERMVDLVSPLLREARSPIGGLGVGFAGLVDHQQGIIESSIILPGWNNVPLADRLRQALDLDVYVDNDATAAGHGEYQALGSPEGLNMILLTLGTGMGGALLIDGHLHRGSTNMSAEFGNTTIDWQGPDCLSGNRGSLNSLASGRALAASAQKMAELHPDSALARHEGPIDCEVLAALYPADEIVRDLVDQAARRIGTGLANLVQIINPDRISLMGGLCGFGERFLDLIRSEIDARCFAVPARHVELGLARHGDLTGAIGAAALARDGAMQR